MKNKKKINFDRWSPPNLDGTKTRKHEGFSLNFSFPLKKGKIISFLALFFFLQGYIALKEDMPRTARSSKLIRG